MTLNKPEIITQEKLIEEMSALKVQKADLTAQLHQLEHKLQHIESALAESEHLKKKTKELLSQSLENFAEEWKRKSEYFPDTRLKGLEKIIALANAKGK